MISRSSSILPAVRLAMEALSNIPSNGPAKEIGSIAGRALASFGHEMDQLLAALSPNAPAPSHLGQNIDVKA